MEPPLGYVPLWLAVDMVGRAVIGNNWRPLAAATKSDGAEEHVREFARVSIFLNPDSEVNGVLKLIAERFGTGEIPPVVRSITGIDRLGPTMWQGSHWRNYFIDGATDLARAREIFVRQEDIDRLIKTLSALQNLDTSQISAPVAAVSAASQAEIPPGLERRGRPIEHDWEDYRLRFQQLWEQYDDFRLQQNQVAGWNSQAAAARKLLDYIETRCDEGKEPHPKTVEDKIADWVKEIDNGA
jgi:hypothetical protein